MTEKLREKFWNFFRIAADGAGQAVIAALVEMPWFPMIQTERMGQGSVK